MLHWNAMHSTRSAAEDATEAAEQPAGGDVGMPLSLRPEWADLQVAAQRHLSATATAVVAIDYAEDDAETLAYFRAVVEANEASARALQLTEEVIGVNPAHYSAWEWRWRCLAATNIDLAAEDPFLRRCTAENPKNYQLWNYRRRLALARGRVCAPLVRGPISLGHMTKLLSARIMLRRYMRTLRTLRDC